jgi:uncharacterized protein (TIGR00369 family)
VDGPRIGWLEWVEPVPDGFLSLMGQTYAQPVDARRAIVEIDPAERHCNRLGVLHGGFLASFADHAYFFAMVAMGRPMQANAVTVDLSMQYIAGGAADRPVRAEVELLGETGRLLFLRLALTQGGPPVAASTATLRKVRDSR